MRLLVALLVPALGACGSRPAATDQPPSLPEAPAPADSLVLTAADSTEVWLVAGRFGVAPDSSTCHERLIEIRRDGRRTPVPLLYTGDVPRLESDSTITTRLWLRCTPGPLHRVNLRTGQPVRLQDG